MPNSHASDFASPKQRLKARFMSIKYRVVGRAPKKTALICPPTSPGSMGDEAMIQGLINKLAEQGVVTDMMIADASEDWSSIDGFRKVVLVPDRTSISNIKTYSNYSHFYLVGADVLDGYYSEELARQLVWQAWLAILVCSKATITGFSFNNKPAPGSIRMFNALPKKVRICLRDGASFMRFSRFTKKKPVQTADLAFLLEPSKDFKPFEKYILWVKEVKAKKNVILGLNISAHSFENIQNFEKKNITRLYKQEVEKLLKNNPRLSIVLLPHDIRGENSDEKILSDLYRQIGAENRQRVCLVKPPLKASAIKSYVRSLDFVLSGRMHLAIACLGVNTPVASVTYQDKFEGLYKLFGLNKLTITPEQATNKNALSNLAEHLMKNSADIKKSIVSKKPEIEKLALKNLG